RRRLACGRLRAGPRRAIRGGGRSVRSLPKDRVRGEAARDHGSREHRADGGGGRGPRAQKGGRPMIRINLLASERAQAKKKLTFQAGQKLIVGGSLILVVALLFIGWRYWSLTRQSTQLNVDIASAQQERTRLQSIIQKVQDFEARKAQLSQRVVLIEGLRREQKGPVHMLDEISKALPPMV